MTDPYVNCPELASENYLLRLVRMEDAPELLKVYSDERAVPIFNSDNCNGDDFHYTTLERMRRQIEFWLDEYERACYVRWTVTDKLSGEAVGTVELFNRRSEDYFDRCGILRLDLRSDHEIERRIAEILDLISPTAFGMFGCEMIATKIPPNAAERIKAAESLGYAHTEQKLVGHGGRQYGDYFVLNK